MSTNGTKAPMSEPNQRSAAAPATVAVRMSISRWVAELQVRASGSRHPDARRATPARAKGHTSERTPSLGALPVSATASPATAA